MDLKHLLKKDLEHLSNFFVQMMSHKNKDPKWITESSGKGGNNNNDNSSSKNNNNNNNKNDKELSTPASKPKAPSVPVSRVFSGTSFLLLLLLLFSCL
jgi:hypothetical protein